jgi:hypothetical protein
MAHWRLREEQHFERLPSGIFFNKFQVAQVNELQAPQVNPAPFVQEFPIFRAQEVQHLVQNAPEPVRCLPVLDVSIEVSVSGLLSHTTLTQSFSNISDLSIKEATYTFPLYDGASVTSFRCSIGKEKVLEGEIRPKEKAKAEYNQAIAEQRVAALFEEHTPEVFETRIGNLPPRTLVTVELTLVNELKADIGGQGILLTIPSSIAPRYGNPPSAHFIATTTSGHGLKIAVDIDMTVPLRKVECQTHPISVEWGLNSQSRSANSFKDLANPPNEDLPDLKKARASLSDRNAVLDKDFVLQILATGSTLIASRAVIAMPPTGSAEAAMMVTLYPRDLFGSQVSLDDFHGEIIFIADRSGSMGGSKIETLREALAVFLKSLPEQCSFNIYSFGTRFSSLWNQSRPYSQQSLDDAINHVKAFDANLGGTDILSPVQDAIRNRTVKAEDPNFTIQFILLTDGQVWNTGELIQLVQQTKTASEGNARFFALGIGDSVSHSLIEGIGREGGGFAEIVPADGQGQWKARVIQMLKGAMMPPRWNCEVLLDGIPVAEFSHDTSASSLINNSMVVSNPIEAELQPSDRPDASSSSKSIDAPNPVQFVQAPFQIPPLHPFTRSSIFLMLDEQRASALKAITIRATRPNCQLTSPEIPFHIDRAKRPTVHFLAAKAIMRDLEGGQSWLHAKLAGESSVSIGEDVQTEAERLGMRWSIASKWTSFIAVDSSDDIQHMTKFYRAQRSELVDLTRSRGTGTHSSPISTNSMTPSVNMKTARFGRRGGRSKATPKKKDSTSHVQNRDDVDSAPLSCHSLLNSASTSSITFDSSSTIDFGQSYVSHARSSESQDWASSLQSEFSGVLPHDQFSSAPLSSAFTNLTSTNFTDSSFMNSYVTSGLFLESDKLGGDSGSWFPLFPASNELGADYTKWSLLTPAASSSTLEGAQREIPSCSRDSSVIIAQSSERPSTTDHKGSFVQPTEQLLGESARVILGSAWLTEPSGDDDTASEPDMKRSRTNERPCSPMRPPGEYGGQSDTGVEASSLWEIPGDRSRSDTSSVFPNSSGTPGFSEAAAGNMLHIRCASDGYPPGGDHNDTEERQSMDTVSLEEIVAVQIATGAFPLKNMSFHAHFILLTHFIPNRIEFECEHLRGIMNKQDAEDILGTHLVLSYLHECCKDTKDVWELMSRKASTYVDKAMSKAGVNQRMLRLYARDERIKNSPVSPQSSFHQKDGKMERLIPNSELLIVAQSLNGAIRPRKPLKDHWPQIKSSFSLPYLHEYLTIAIEWRLESNSATGRSLRRKQPFSQKFSRKDIATGSAEALATTAIIVFYLEHMLELVGKEESAKLGNIIGKAKHEFLEPMYFKWASESEQGNMWAILQHYWIGE